MALNSKHCSQPRKLSAVPHLQDRTNLDVIMLALSKSTFVLQVLDIYELLAISCLTYSPEKVPIVSELVSLASARRL